MSSIKAPVPLAVPERGAAPQDRVKPPEPVLLPEQAPPPHCTVSRPEPELETVQGPESEHLRVTDADAAPGPASSDPPLSSLVPQPTKRSTQPSAMVPQAARPQSFRRSSSVIRCPFCAVPQGHFPLRPCAIVSSHTSDAAVFKPTTLRATPLPGATNLATTRTDAKAGLRPAPSHPCRPEAHTRAVPAST